MNSGRPRRSAAAAPSQEAGAASTSTRSSRIAAATEDAFDDAMASPSRTRSKRAGRPSAAAKSSRVSQRQQSSSPAAESEDEEMDLDGSQELKHDEDDDDNFQPASRASRPVRARPSRTTAPSQLKHEDEDEEDDEEDDGRTPARRQRTTLNQRSDRRSGSRAVKTDDAAALLSDGNDDSLGSESEERYQRRPARQKSQSSPLKAVAEQASRVPIDAGTSAGATGIEAIGLPSSLARGAQPNGRSARRGRQSEDDDQGWMEEIDNSHQAREVFAGIITTLRSWLKEKGQLQVSAFMENLPANPDSRYLDRVERSITLKAILENVLKGAYTSTAQFETDILQVFRNARRYFEPGSEQYGGVVALQRMYQHLTQSVESARDAVDEELTSRNFSSVRFGPCQEGDNEGFGESSAIGPKTNAGRLQYKGDTISIGNWVHLSNPTDPARPIIAQVFKVRSEDLGDRRQDWITANWFFRPEQSRHPRSTMFWDNEVIKTSYMVEHHVEDVLEKVCVVFYTKASRGRPVDGDGGWRTGDPLYICENRYQADRDSYFKIKNWASCLPDEVKNRRNDMIEYDHPIALPEKLVSPFLRGVPGPGEIVKEQRPTMPSFITSSRKLPAAAVAAVAPPQAPRRRTIKATIDRDSLGAPGQYSDIPVLFADWRDEVQAQRRNFYRLKAEHRAAAEAAASAAADERARSADGNLAQSSSSVHATDSAPPAPNASVSPLPPSQILAGASAGAMPSTLPPIAPAVDRSLNSALANIDVSAYFKALPEETQQLFHQDPETGNVVWYPAPPIVGPTDTELQRRWNDGERFQSHSLDYMYHMASGKTGGKRKQAGTTKGTEQDLTATESMQSATASAPETLMQDAAGEAEQNVGTATRSESINLDEAFSLALKQAAHSLSRYVTVD